MNPLEQARFAPLYESLLQTLRLQGKQPKTIEAYARAVRRTANFFNRCPDNLTATELKDYFATLLKTHSWSTIKLDRNGLQFFYRHVLDKQWDWVTIIKPPTTQRLPDNLSQTETFLVINQVRKLRYRVFLLTTYSMGLRLGEGLGLEVGDIDGPRKRVHIRDGKGGKDRYVPIPEPTLEALRRWWQEHRHPRLLFPSPAGGAQHMCRATGPMDRGGIQTAMKAAVSECGIQRRITIHSLRHYAEFRIILSRA